MKREAINVAVSTVAATFHKVRAAEGSSSPTPPASSRRHPSLLHFHRPLFPSKTRRHVSLPSTLLRCRLCYFILLPLLCVAAFFTCPYPLPDIMGLYPPLPGSVYRSHLIFDKLWDDIRSDNSSPIELSSVWKYRRRKQKDQRPCQSSNNSAMWHADTLATSGYLVVEANGGLNQQRASICNAVAVAGLLNASLVIPRFEFNTIWRDASNFSDIYDEDHFLADLEGYVKVVRELPTELMERYGNNISNVPNFRVHAWASADYYLEEVHPILREQGVVSIAPFANRLAMQAPPHIQFLRCLVNYQALRFSFPISTLAKKLVSRMAGKSSRTDGKYVSVHLRFEEDMLAFSCCRYDGGWAENFEMDIVRQRGWKEKFKRKARMIRPGLNRINGKCPLTPVEVGMMLKGMGFDNNTSIYLASGQIYKAERHLAPLQKIFPLLFTKETLATEDELANFEGYSSRLAALDYTVCLFSEVFVTTQGGNFPHFLMGHRRYLYGGHAKTIKPDKPRLVILLHDMGISWKAFKDEMESMLVESNREGMMVPKTGKTSRKASIYTYPFPGCCCLWESQNSTLKLFH